MITWTSVDQLSLFKMPVAIFWWPYDVGVDARTWPLPLRMLTCYHGSDS